MKKSLLIIIAVFAFASCKKDKPTTPTIYCSWRLNSVITDNGKYVVAEKDKDSYQFNTNSKYVKTMPDKNTIQGNFTFTLSDESEGRRFGSITFSNPTDTQPLTIKGDTIVTGSSYIDGPRFIYARIK